MKNSVASLAFFALSFALVACGVPLENANQSKAEEAEGITIHDDLTCGTGLTNCFSVCVNKTDDRNNCGACNTKCASTQVCTASKCVGCASGDIVCGDSCVADKTDSKNCGKCGNVCASGHTCSAGTCVATKPTCTSPETLCGSTCTNVQFDSANCGGCGKKCAATTGEMCVDSACFAPPYIGAPVLHSAVSVGKGEIQIAWSDPVIPAGFTVTDYFVHFNYGNGLQKTATVVAPNATHTELITGLTSGTYYNVSIVVAWHVNEGNGGNVSGDSNTSNFIFNVLAE